MLSKEEEVNARTEALVAQISTMSSEKKAEFWAWFRHFVQSPQEEPPRQEKQKPPQAGKGTKTLPKKPPEAPHDPPPDAVELLTVYDVAREYDLTERHARRMIKGMAHTIVKGDGKRWRYAIARDVFEEGLKHQGRAF